LWKRYNDLSDAQTTAALVIRAQRGDGGAVAALARVYLRPAFSVALAIVGRPADAEDVAQDALVTALQRIAMCREPARFAGWLMQIVRNRARNWLDARRLRDVGATEDAAGQADRVASPSVSPDNCGMKQRLLMALAALSTIQREVALLHDLEDWTHAEIADSLGISEGMSRQHLFHARRTLRARLGDDTLKEATHD
jgi:RNA polymerase sigma-70 factor, ECF subfamily